MYIYLYFLLPNVMKDDDGNRGIAIRLFHGCCISWDGHKLYHCTGLRDKGNENHVYGNFFGAKQPYYRKSSSSLVNFGES